MGWEDILFLIFPTFLFLPDLDECESGDEMCDDICINTIGSYRCECNEGRSLDEDRRGCSGRCYNTIKSTTNWTFRERNKGL